MTILFLGMLAAAWVVVVLPAVGRAREGTPLRSAERFTRALDCIAPPSAPQQRAVTARAATRRAIRRRRWILGFFVGALLLTGLRALSGAGPWEQPAAVAGTGAVYVAALAGEQRRRLEQKRKVRTIRRPVPSHVAETVSVHGVHRLRAVGDGSPVIDPDTFSEGRSDPVLSDLATPTFRPRSV